MQGHRKVIPSIKVAGTHLYTWVERGTCPAWKHRQHNVLGQGSNHDRSIWRRVHYRASHWANEQDILYGRCKCKASELEIGEKKKQGPVSYIMDRGDQRNGKIIKS